MQEKEGRLRTAVKESKMVQIVKSTFVQPDSGTPNHEIWLSILDLLVARDHTPAVYVYPHNGSDNFFSVELLKSSLSRALVFFYPFAGRLGTGSDGRLLINCTGDGVLFVEAASELTLAEFGDFGPSDENRKLVVPSANAGNPPLVLLQVTAFKCGGICLGTAVHHTLADGLSALHFINSWAELTRGRELTLPPFVDRTLLRARNPSFVISDHVEYFQSPSSVKPAFTSAIFKLSKDQIAAFKRNGGGSSCLSTFRVAVAHIWRSACKARRLAAGQQTRLYMTADARSRVSPQLPPGYLGNAIFRCSAVAPAEKIISGELEIGAGKVRAATARLDDAHVRSLIDFLEKQEDVSGLAKGSWTMPPTDLWIISWQGLPIYEADFGWGRPIFMGRARLQFSGLVYISHNAVEDGGLTIAAALEPENMPRFKEIFYGDIPEME